MKLLLLTVCVALASADVSHVVRGQGASSDAEAPILKQELDVGLEGQYQWAYETGNGISAQEQGQLKNVGAENEAQVAQGQAQWTSPEGQVIQLQYVADENGYQPQKLLLLTVCVALASADVSHVVRGQGASSDAEAPILKQELDVGLEGQYQWAYETGNGISAQEQGQLKNVGAENEAQVAQGQAQWTSPEGQVIQLQYVADENGYQPQGAHLPTSPPIPEAIVRALKYIQEHPPPPESNN